MSENKKKCTYFYLTTYGRSLPKEQEGLNVGKLDACIKVWQLMPAVCRSKAEENRAKCWVDNLCPKFAEGTTSPKCRKIKRSLLIFIWRLTGEVCRRRYYRLPASSHRFGFVLRLRFAQLALRGTTSSWLQASLHPAHFVLQFSISCNS